jgi:hypothetical protein
MEKPERSGYTAHDFLSWKSTGQLAISPRFQRRKVWGDAARSYLIDTLITGFPVPPIYIRLTKVKGQSLPVREIVDGQQRMSAAIDFVEGKFTLSASLHSPYAGKRFLDLPAPVRDKIMGYSFICEVFQSITDEEVLSIFARLNTYSVRLNAQELRNGRFFGPFKQTAYSLAYSHLTFWRNNRVFSEMAIARMAEAELVSELLVAMLHGMQDKKKSIDDFYKRYDSSFPRRREMEKRFRKVIDEITECLGNNLKSSQFRRTPLFYSMFLALYHRMYGLPGFDTKRAGTDKLAAPERQAFKRAIDTLSDVVADGRRDVIRKGYAAFVGASLRQTDNIKPRQARLTAIYTRAFG